MNGQQLTTLAIDLIKKADGFGVNVVQTSTNGTSDVIACMPPYGRYLAIEIKGTGDTEKVLQLAKLNDVIRANGVAGIARTEKDILDLIALAKTSRVCPILKLEVKSFRL